MYTCKCGNTDVDQFEVHEVGQVNKWMVCHIYKRDGVIKVEASDLDSDSPDLTNVTYALRCKICGRRLPLYKEDVNINP